MTIKLQRSKDSAPDVAAPSTRSAIESELAKVTADIAFHGQAEKSAKAEKEKARDKFFKLADQIVALDGLDRKHVVIPHWVGYGDEVRFTPEEWVAREYPGYQIISKLAKDDQLDTLVIEEIPGQQTYTYVNNTLGMVFARQRSMVKGGIDIDWLREDHPEVFEAVTTWETVYSFDDERAHLYFNEHPETQTIFEQVCFDGTPQMKLASPTKLKDDE